MDANRNRKYSPFGRLSNELVNEIFIFSFISEAPYSQFLSIRLSHVCAHWREIAIANWRLWNEITFSPWQSKRQMENSVIWIKELISRTRNAPIHLSIAAYDWNEFWDEVVAPLFLELEARVRKIELTMDYWLLPCKRRLMEAISQTKAPLLDSILIATINNQRTLLTQPSEDITLTNTFRRLRTVIYNEIMTNNILPGPSLGYITGFTADLIFSAMQQLSQWLEILKCMPNLENLYLSFKKSVITSTVDSDTPKIYLTHLKNFCMSASREECAEFCKYLKLPPGCTFSIECMKSEDVYTFNGIYALAGVSEEAIRQVVLRWLEETCLDVSDKHLLELDIHPNFLRISVYSQVSPSPNRPILMLNLSASTGWCDMAPNNLEYYEDNYISLVNLVRMMHTMQLTNAAEISLRVHQQSLFESFAAPVLGPFVRACTLAKKFHLTGNRVMFMLPILKNRIMNRGEHDFDLSFFANNDTWSFPDYLRNVIAAMKPEEGRQSIRSCLTPSTPEEEKKYRMRENLLETQQIKTIRFLHIDFNVTTLEGHIHMLNFLRWYENHSRVLQEFQEKSGVKTHSTSNYFLHDDSIENTNYDIVVEKASKFGTYHYSNMDFERDFGQWFNPDDVGS